MTRSMFQGLNELKSHIVGIDKLLVTTSTANCSKRTPTYTIKIVNMQNMYLLLLLLYITHVVACQCSQLHAKVKNLIQQSKSEPTKMDANSKSIVY